MMGWGDIDHSKPTGRTINRTPISENQIRIIKSLYRQLGQDYEENDIYQMTFNEADGTIKELIAIKNNVFRDINHMKNERWYEN